MSLYCVTCRDHHGITTDTAVQPPYAAIHVNGDVPRHLHPETREELT